jgi:hypothetical protein
MKAHPLRQNFRALGLGCLLLSALSGTALADFDGDSTAQSGDMLLRPISVVSTSGNVSNHFPGGCTWKSTCQTVLVAASGCRTPSTADSVTDKGQPVQKGNKMKVICALDDSSGARPGYTYLLGLGPGAHSIEIGQ